jgi:hypothetical protein
MLGIAHVHEYVLKLVDADQCPQMDENCPEVDKLDITKCFSGRLANISISDDRITSSPHPCLSIQIELTD